MIEVHEERSDVPAKIIVVGVGGGGNNAINRMIEDKIEGVELVAVNTDKQDLDKSLAPKQIAIGEKVTKGLGAGGRPEVGEEAANESREEIAEAIKDADMVIVTCGMGGGTGTGAAPVVAEIAKSLNILTVGVVTRPFKHEGKVRFNNAEEGIARLKENVDTIIVIPNDKIFDICDKNASLSDALRKADEVLQSTVSGITDIITKPSIINLDFADISTAMRDKGIAHIGAGIGKGESRASEAVQAAVNNPLLETTIESASDVIVFLSGDVSLKDSYDAPQYITDITGEDVNVLLGCAYDPSEADVCKVTVIATGLYSKPASSKYGAPKYASVGGAKPTFTRPAAGGFTANRTTAARPAGGVTIGSGTQRQVNIGAGNATTTKPQGTVARPMPSTVAARNKSISIPSFLKKGDNKSAE